MNHGAGPSVLIVEDEAIIALDIENRVTKLGYRVCGKTVSGEEVLTLVEKERPDIVLMDIMLRGDMTGLDVADRIREHYSIPVVFITAFSDEETLERAKYAGPFGYLLKPINEKELKITLEIALFRHETESKLLRSETRLRAAMTQSGEGMAQMNEDLSVLYVNPAILRMFGCAEESEPPVSMEVWFHLSSIETLNAHIGDLKRRGIKTSERPLELIGLRSEGTRFLTEVTLTVIEEKPVLCFFVMVRDVTKRRQYEEMLKNARETAEEADRAKSEFIANMSHELRTPLNSIFGMTDLALELGQDKEQISYLHIVQEAAGSLLGLINTILDFSKIEAGKMKAESVPFNPEELLEDSVTKVAVQAHRKGLEINVDIDPATPSLVAGDAQNVSRIIVNLLSNAVKFTDAGRVTVSCSPLSELPEDALNRHWCLDTPKTSDETSGRLEESLVARGNRRAQEDLLRPEAGAEGKALILHFAVTDTGIGIPAEKIPKIFESFTQLDSSPTRSHGGTGLGLTIVQRLVELLDGRLCVQSHPGRGSNFDVYVPVRENVRREDARRDESKRKADTRKEQNGQARRIVCAHVFLSSEPERRLVARTLRIDGYEVIEYARYSEAPKGLLQSVCATSDAAAASPAKAVFVFDARLEDRDLLFRDFLGCGDLISGKQVIVLCRTGVSEDKIWKQMKADAQMLLKPVRRRLLLAAVAKADAAQPRTAPTAAAGKEGSTLTLRVLQVEDDANNSLLVERVLRKIKYEVKTARNPIEAFRILQDGGTDLILMDLQMPEMDGYEAVRRIRSQLEYEGIPIIAVTAHALTRDRDRCAALGMDGFLAKPYTARQLETIIRMVWDRSRSGKKGDIIWLSQNEELVARWTEKADARTLGGFIEQVRRSQEAGGFGELLTYLESYRDQDSSKLMDDVVFRLTLVARNNDAKKLAAVLADLESLLETSPSAGTVTQ